MDYHPGASAPFPLDEGQLRSILATENGRKLLLLLQKTDPAVCRPLPEEHRTLPHYDHQTPGTEKGG